MQNFNPYEDMRITKIEQFQKKYNAILNTYEEKKKVLDEELKNNQFQSLKKGKTCYINLNQSKTKTKLPVKNILEEEGRKILDKKLNF